MNVLIAGLTLFFLVHLVPMLPNLRQRLVGGLGEAGYKGLFSLVSLAGLGVIIWGKSIAPFVPVYEPGAPRGLVFALVLVGFILQPAAHMPTNIRRFTRHPMLWGIVAWAAAHLLANGDQASLLLFGSFLFYSVVNMSSANRRGAQKSTLKVPLARDLMVVMAGTLVYGVFAYFHGALFGYPLV